MDNGNYYNHNNSGSNFERTVGKSIMGVAASILVFISLIMFATLLIPDLTDMGKVIIMFSVSSIITAIGLILVICTKSKGFLAILGCGMGAFYISLMVSALHFELIDRVPLYILTLIWAVAVAVLSRFQSMLFTVLGQIGVLFSTFLGAFMCSTGHDEAGSLMIIVFFIISQAVFIGAGIKKSFTWNLANYIPYTFSTMWVSFLILDVYKEFPSVRVASAVVGLFIIISILLMIFAYKSSGAEEVGKGIIGLFLSLFAISTICSVAGGSWADPIYPLLGMIVSAVIFVCAENGMGKKSQAGKIILQCANLIYFVMSLSEQEILGVKLMNYVTILPIVFLLVLAANKSKKYHYQIFSFVLFYFNIYFIDTARKMDYSWIIYLTHLVLAVLIMTFGIVTTAKDTQKYRSGNKVAYYIIGNFNIMCVIFCLEKDLLTLTQLPSCFIILIAAVIVGGETLLLSLSKRLCTNPVTGKEETGIIISFSVVNLLLALNCLLTSISLSLSFRRWEENLPYQIALVLVALVLISTNIGRTVRGLGSGGAIYIGVKYTLFMILAFASFARWGYLMSISCLIVAIVCICVGFRNNSKALRIYGLIVSLISVIKLVLIDIYYSSTALRAFSFLICGLICFAISIIYTLLEKKLNDDDTMKMPPQGWQAGPQQGMPQGMPVPPQQVPQGMPVPPQQAPQMAPQGMPVAPQQAGPQQAPQGMPVAPQQAAPQVAPQGWQTPPAQGWQTAPQMAAPQQVPPQGGSLMGGQVPPVTLEGKPVMVPPVHNEQ